MSQGILLSSKFRLAIYFTRGNVYVSMLLSPFIQLSPSPTVSPSLFSMSASQLLLLPYKYVHTYHQEMIQINLLTEQKQTHRL